VVALSDDLPLRDSDRLPSAVAGPEIFRRRKLIEWHLPFHHTARCGAIVFEKRISVRAVDERDIEDFGVAQRLLHACAERMVVVLRFDQRQRNARLVIEDVVGLPGLATFDELAANDDPALREVHLFTNLRHEVPTCGPAGQCRRDVLGSNVGFGQVLLVHDEFPLALSWIVPFATARGDRFLLAAIDDAPAQALEAQDGSETPVKTLVDKSVSAIERAVRRLRDSGRLRYVGPQKGGYWEVME
jgi:hypothetical protein